MSVSSDQSSIETIFPNLPGYRGKSLPVGNKKRFFKIHSGQFFSNHENLEYPSYPHDRSISNIGIHPPGFVLRNETLRSPQILSFVENGSLSIVESPIGKCGTPQTLATLVKRSIILKETDGTPFLPQDFMIGGTISVYGRVYQIVDCDQVTRDFYFRELGIFQTRVEYPKQFHVNLNYDPNPSHPLRPRKLESLPSTTHPHPEITKLVFICLWDNSGRLYGDQHEYLLLYHLSDDCVEIFSSPKYHTTNDHFSRLFKRARLPKPFTAEEIASRVGPRAERKKYYHWTDLRIGVELKVYARSLRIIDAEESTRTYFEDVGPSVGVLSLGPAELPPEPALIKHEKQIPPYNGFGSEEDSLRSCFGSLQPTVPPQRKLGENKVLSFLASMVSDCAYDSDRRFVITFYVQDRTLQVREPSQRNSGFVSGLFLGRSVIKLPDGTSLSEKDLFLGNQLLVSSHNFLLRSAAEDTLRWLEDRRLPKADPIRVMNRIATFISQSVFDGSFAHVLENKEDQLASSQGRPTPPRGFVTPETFLFVLNQFGITNQESVLLALNQEVSSSLNLPPDYSQQPDFEPLSAHELISILRWTSDSKQCSPLHHYQRLIDFILNPSSFER